MAIIKKHKESNLQEVNEKAINSNERIKSTKIVDENEKDCSVKSHISKTIRKNTKKFIPIDEDDFENEETTSPPSSKGKIIGKGGQISKSPLEEE